MKIVISGLPGSGKSTLSKILSAHYGLPLCSAGEMFRQLARERCVSLAEFGRLAETDPGIDRLIDERQKKLAEEKSDLVLEGRLSGFLVNSDIKIWLKAPIEVRSRRIASREGKSFEAAKEETVNREMCEATRYMEYYGIDISDLDIYDIIIDSNRWDAERVGRIAIAAIDSLA
ncbi:MAG TPA: AAA family ATPase [Candidatus Methanoperedenaceae archaeon]|nr:AAA family ATPase [Candidatus Methanoperedenaceae archaeon]